MNWTAIAGQERVTRLLRRLYEQHRLPHALLFHGPEGVGKEAAAIALAATLNCTRGEWEACGSCPDCMQMRTLQHPRLLLVFPMPAKDDEDTAIDKFTADELAEYRELIEAKAANPYHRLAMARAQGIKISSIRDIRRQASYRAGSSGRTVVIVCEADRMNAGAANALLKTLEEPSGDLLLVLCTARRDALLPTIISRCQQVRFDPLRVADIETALQGVPDVSPDLIPVAARLCGGNYRLALEYATEGGLTDRARLRDFLRAVMRMQPVELMEHIRRVAPSDDRAATVAFLRSLHTWFRDVLAVQSGRPEAMINIDLRESIERFSEHYTQARCGEAIDHIEDVIDRIQKNVHLHTLMIVLSQRLRRAIQPE